jgi:hypothetical protein
MLAVASLVRMAVAIPNGSNLTHEAGVWTALAMDLHDGLFYRPIFSDDGYGGTRYAPLHVLLQALGIRGGLPPLAAGLALTLLSGVVLFAGVYQVLRLHDVGRTLAWMGVGLLLAGASLNNGLLTIRADLLPAGLNVMGLVLVALTIRRRHRLVVVAAGALFALAVFAKVTAIAGVLTAVIVLVRHRHYRDALLVGLVAVVVTIGCYAAADVASDGRLVENFRACAAVGAGLSETLAGPSRLAFVLWTQDPVLLGLLLFAAIVLARLPREAWSELPTIALLVTLVITCAIFLTPGTSGNHLVDLEAMVVLFLIVQLHRGRFDARLTHGALAAACMAAILLQANAFVRRDRTPQIEQIRSIADGQPLPLNEPIFSDDALVPIVFGQRPFVLDDYMFGVVAQARPEMRQDVYARLDRREFPLVVTRWDPLGPGRARIYGNAFGEHLSRNYELWGKRAGRFIYRPKRQAYVDARS